MIFADYHVHTSFSPDAHIDMEEMVLRGIELGLTEMAFTDHVDLEPANEDFITITDYKKYYPVFKKLQGKYADRINLLLGIENGFQEKVVPQMDKIVAETPFDFVLLSVHSAGGKSYSTPEYFEGITQETATMRYLETILKAVSNYKNYDSLAHLTCLARYIESKKIPYSIYKEYFDEIFNLLIAGGKCLEVNTSGYRYGLNLPIPNWSLLKCYYQAGGRYITLGSDAHKAEDLAMDFQRVQDGLEIIGFKKLSTFRSREMILQPINGSPLQGINHLITKRIHG
ncbi:MAG: histidinol-phosphatase HisJ family protein [Clostridiales bacterium]